MKAEVIYHCYLFNR